MGGKTGGTTALPYAGGTTGTTSGTTNQTGTNTYTPSAAALASYQSVLGQLGGLPNFQNFGGQLVAGVNPQEYQGITGTNAAANEAQPYIQQAAGMATQAAQPITAAQIQNYQNPYTQQVVNATEAQFQNQNAQQQSALQGNAAAQGALGGDRVGVAQANLAGQQSLAQSPIIANLYSQGYGQALQEANTQQQAMAQGAYSLGNLGVSGQNAALQGAGAQISAGGLEQQTQQALDQALIQQYLSPYSQLGQVAGIAGGIGSLMGGTNVGTQAGTQTGATTGMQQGYQSQLAPSPLNAIAGLGVAGVGLLGGTGAFGSTGYLNPNYSGSIFSKDGGRISGFADGGSPNALPSASSYYTVIPQTQMQRGNTMPQPISFAPMNMPQAPQMQMPSQPQQQQQNNSSSILSDAVKGLGTSLKGIGGHPTDVGTAVQVSGDTEASGGRVRGFADGGDTNDDDIYFNPSSLSGVGTGSGSFINTGGGPIPADLQTPTDSVAPGAAQLRSGVENVRGGEAAPDTGEATDAINTAVNDRRAGVNVAAYRPTADDLVSLATDDEKPKKKDNSDLWNAVTLAGFSIAGSGAHTLGQAIGQGGQQGVKAYVEAKQFAETREDKQKALDLQVKRLNQLANQHTETLQQQKELHEVPSGFERGPNGSLQAVSQGPHDPAVIAREAQAKRVQGMSEDAMQPMVDAYYGGNKSVLSQIARGTSGAQNLQQFWTMLASKLKAEGKDGRYINAMQAQYQADAKAAGTSAVREANIETAVNEARGTFPLAVQRSLELPRTDIVPFNKLLEMYRTGTSSPEQGKLAVALQGAMTAYSQAMSRTGVNSVDAQKHARELIEGAQGHLGLKARFDQMEQEMQIALSAPAETRKHITERLLGIEPSSPSAPAATAPAASSAAPKVGDRKQFKQGWGVWDGRTWMPESKT